MILAQEEFESPLLILKELRLNHSTTGPLINLHIYNRIVNFFFNLKVYTAQCKYRTYFFRLQNGHITFMLTGLSKIVK